MGLFTRFVVLLLFTAQGAYSATLRGNGTDSVIPSSGILPGVYIVELCQDIQKETFYDNLAATGVHVRHRMDLSSHFFNGVSFEIKVSNSNSNSSDVMQYIQDNQHVQESWPVHVAELGVPDESPIKTPSPSRAKRQTPPEKPFSPHVLTQVDKLLAEGYTGKGIRVAIIDSGVDYSHPALGGCFGSGCLVDKGYDFVGDDYRAFSVPPNPDNDPMDNCFGHGTHVAGTVAAQLTGYGFTGAAPGVKLSAYRIWNCVSGTNDEIQIASFIRAVDDGADIIQYSNGFASAWSSHVVAMVASRIAQSGVIFSISIGNSGGLGMFQVITPASAVGGIAVGAVSNTNIPVFLSRGSFTAGDGTTGNDTGTNFGFLMGEPAFKGKVTLSLWSATDKNNACNPLPEDTPDLRDRIVLLEFPTDSRVSRCYPQDQSANIVAKGGRYLAYFERINSTIRDDILIWTEGIEGVARVTPYQALQWDAMLRQGSKITATFADVNSTYMYLEELENDVNGGLMANLLSSWGPTWELNPKPQLVSPGENILSTYPVALGSYRIMTGTSMASPLISGAYALLGEVYGKIEPDRLRRLLTTTSKPLTWWDSKETYEMLAPVPQQGSGLVQVWNAAHTTAELNIDSISFNDTDHFMANATFTIQNTASVDTQFQLSHRKAVTMYTLGEYASGLSVAPFPNPIVEEWADIEFSAGTINIPAGGSMDIIVTCTPPANVNATLLPIYSGFITLTGTNTTLSLPYMGMVGSMRNTTILTPASVFLANSNVPAPAGSQYSIPRPDPANPLRTDDRAISTGPSVSITGVLGMREVHVDVLQGDNVLGSLAGWPQFSLQKGAIRAWFNGLLADGTVLEEGLYTIRVRSLRIFGVREREGDWDVVETVGFGIQYCEGCEA